MLQDQGESREVDRSLVGWGQENLGFIVVLQSETFPPGITGRREDGGGSGGKDHFQEGFDILNSNSIGHTLFGASPAGGGSSQLLRHP